MEQMTTFIKKWQRAWNWAFSIHTKYIWPWWQMGPASQNLECMKLMCSLRNMIQMPLRKKRVLLEGRLQWAIAIGQKLLLLVSNFAPNICYRKINLGIRQHQNYIRCSWPCDYRSLLSMLLSKLFEKARWKNEQGWDSSRRQGARNASKTIRLAQYEAKFR